jgi:hypothetical protein
MSPRKSNKVVAPKKVPPLPKVAPELYEKRKSESENAYAFLVRVYGQWAGYGLSLPYLGKTDPKLYRAMYDRRKSGDPFPFHIPKKSDVTDATLEEIEGKSVWKMLCPRCKRLLRAVRAKQMRRKRKQKQAPR